MFAPFLAHAWRATGRPAYRQALRQALKDARIDFDDLARYGRMDEPSFSVAVSHEGVNKLGCELAAVMNLTPYAIVELPVVKRR